MTPEEEERFKQRICDIVDEHPEGISEGAILDEMWLRGFITPEMWEEFAFDGFLTNLSYIFERKVLWTEVSPRQIQRQRRRSKRPPIVKTGILCDRQGRKICTVGQDATGEYYWPNEDMDVMRRVMDEYFMANPEDYRRPEHRK
jgi:hypothetical protein